MYRIEIVGDWLMLHHPEHGGVDIAKLVANPLAKSPEWEKLIHEMAAGPRLAAAAVKVLDAWAERDIQPRNADAVRTAVVAIDELRYSLAAADPAGPEAPKAPDAERAREAGRHGPAELDAEHPEHGA